MKNLFLPLLSFTLTAMLTSCQWISHKDKYELNADIFNHMKYKPTAFVLSELGQRAVFRDFGRKSVEEVLHFLEVNHLKLSTDYSKYITPNL